MVDVMNLEETLSKSIEAMLDLQIQQNPAMAQHRDIFMRFFNKYMSWASLEEDFLQMYTESFTEEELLALRDFYLSPVGQKSVRLMPELSAKGAMIGQTRVQENLPELMKMLESADAQ